MKLSTIKFALSYVNIGKTYDIRIHFSETPK